MNDWIIIMLRLFAYWVLWYAVDYGRKEPIKPLSENWFVICLALILSVIILTNVNYD